MNSKLKLKFKLMKKLIKLIEKFKLITYLKILKFLLKFTLILQ